MEVVYEALGRDGPDTNAALTTAFEDLETMMAENKFEEIEGIIFWFQKFWSHGQIMGRDVMKYSFK